MSLDNDLAADVHDDPFWDAKVDTAEIAAVTKRAAKRSRRARMRVSEGG